MEELLRPTAESQRSVSRHPSVIFIVLHPQVPLRFENDYELGPRLRYVVSTNQPPANPPALHLSKILQQLEASSARSILKRKTSSESKVQREMGDFGKSVGRKQYEGEQ